MSLNTVSGLLSLTSTNSDLNGQSNLGTGEYIGVQLSTLGFTGSEDFTVTTVISGFTGNVQANQQFGLAVGASSAFATRMGLIGTSHVQIAVAADGSFAKTDETINCEDEPDHDGLCRAEQQKTRACFGTSRPRTAAIPQTHPHRTTDQHVVMQRLCEMCSCQCAGHAMCHAGIEPAWCRPDTDHDPAVPHREGLCSLPLPDYRRSEVVTPSTRSASWPPECEHRAPVVLLRRHLPSFAPPRRSPCS